MPTIAILTGFYLLRQIDDFPDTKRDQYMMSIWLLSSLGAAALLSCLPSATTDSRHWAWLIFLFVGLCFSASGNICAQVVTAQQVNHNQVGIGNSKYGAPRVFITGLNKAIVCLLIGIAYDKQYAATYYVCSVMFGISSLAALIMLVKAYNRTPDYIPL